MMMTRMRRTTRRTVTIEPAFSVLNVEPSARRERPEKHAGVGCVIVEGRAAYDLTVRRP